MSNQNQPIRACGLIVLLLFGSACGPSPNSIDAEPGQITAVSQVANDGAGEERSLAPAVDRGGDATAIDTANAIEIAVDVPPIPPVTLPDVSVLNDTAELVGDALGDLINPVRGIDLLTTSCADDGELVYSGSLTGNDVFSINPDGSGEYRERTPDGKVVSIEVAEDGSGIYRSSDKREAVTIEVHPDGSGTYFKQSGRDKVTIEVEMDGSGVYFDSLEGRQFSVERKSDGSGAYVLRDESGLTSIDAKSNGTGEYFLSDTEGGITKTVKVNDDGSWAFNEIEASRRVEVVVNTDGSGSYALTGIETGRFDFGPDGYGADGETTYHLTLPPKPEFNVAASFPPLGSLGELEPPCATVLRFDSALLFDFGDATLRPDSLGVLEAVVPALNQAGRPIEIVGHTDSVGSSEANLELSFERAESVNQALTRSGLNVETEVVGIGEESPAAPNDSPDGSDNPTGRAQNRRVEIIIREPPNRS